MHTANSTMTSSTLSNTNLIMASAARKAICTSVKNRNRSSSSKNEKWISSHQRRITLLSLIMGHHREEVWKWQLITSFHRRIHTVSAIITSKSSRKRRVLWRKSQKRMKTQSRRITLSQKNQSKSAKRREKRLKARNESPQVKNLSLWNRMKDGKKNLTLRKISTWMLENNQRER